MPHSANAPLVAVDIGNSRIKFGIYPTRPAATGTAARTGNTGTGQIRLDAVPRPDAELDLLPGSDSLDRLTTWLRPYGIDDVEWYIGSVNRPQATQLISWLRSQSRDVRITLLTARDLPLAIRLERPDMVGIDRLLGAVAVNAMRPVDRPAVVVDLGTAITVDLVTCDGAFQGGAILPGIGMSARAFHQFTDLLPLIDMTELKGPPAAVGKSTVAAMTSGLYWGAVGGVRELVARYAKELEEESARPPFVVLTGGAAASVAELIADDAVLVPHLILGAIAIAANG